MAVKRSTLLLLIMLAGCASAPPTRPPPLPAPPPPVVRAPAPAPAPPAVPTSPPVTAPVLPYGAEVAARFPEPRTAYRTPAMQPGRSAYTSNAEMSSALRALVRDGRGTAPTVQLLALGSSQAGVPIEALVFTRLADASAGTLAATSRPTVLLVGQQHGDEPAGSEALLVIAQELAGGRLAPLLDRIHVVVLPRANPDGAERASRVSASGIDINRDHLLLRTPEAQAMAQLVREFRPVVVVDAHEHTVVGRYLEKFGAVQRFDALLQFATTANLPPFVTRAADEWFHRPLQAALQREGLTSEWYYTTSLDLTDRKVSMGGVQPDTGRNVNGLKNTISLLIETRGVGIGRLHFARRVHTQVVAAQSVLASAAARADDLLKLRGFVEQEVSSLACQGDVVVEAAATPTEKSLLMLDPQTGADKAVLVAWDSALQLVTRKQRARPCGYWLAADQADAVGKLRTLGITVQQFAQRGAVRGETWRELARDESMRSDVRGTVADARAVVRLQVETVPSLIDVPAGSFWVPLAQPLAHLVVAAMEPDTQNSYLASGIVAGLDRQARLMALPDARLVAPP